MHLLKQRIRLSLEGVPDVPANDVHVEGSGEEEVVVDAETADGGVARAVTRVLAQHVAHLQWRHSLMDTLKGGMSRLRHQVKVRPGEIEEHVLFTTTHA